VWSAWSSGRRSGDCIGLRASRSGRSAGGWGCIARRFAGRWRRRSRRGTRGRRAGRRWIRLETGSVSSSLLSRGFRRSACGRWRRRWAMRVGRRSSTITFARCARGFWPHGRSADDRGRPEREGAPKGVRRCRSSRPRHVDEGRLAGGVRATLAWHQVGVTARGAGGTGTIAAVDRMNGRALVMESGATACRSAPR
jgi:hypothetical protein